MRSHVSLPRVLRTLTLVGSITLCEGILSVFAASDSSLVLIPGGWLMMGSADRAKDERPVHKVYVDSFYLGKTEVTVWEYLECVKNGKCSLPSWWNRPFFGPSYDKLSGNEWLMLPVTGVSWDDAQRFCAWKGKNYRLPTEAEWEYAARAGSSSTYPWGDATDSAAVYAVVDERLCVVMSRRPNRFGVYDMIGNVWEWCNDRYGKKYYAVSEERNPQGPNDPTRYPHRVVRGGAWNEYVWNLRTANRNYGEQHRRYGGVGFRVCVSKAE